MQSFDRVAIATDRFASEGIARGTIGYIIEDFPDGKMIEVSDPATGETIVILEAREGELEPAPE